MRGSLLAPNDIALSVCIRDTCKRPEIEVLVEILILKKIWIKNIYFSWRNLCFRKTDVSKIWLFNGLSIPNRPPSWHISNNHPHCAKRFLRSRVPPNWCFRASVRRKIIDFYEGYMNPWHMSPCINLTTSQMLICPKRDGLVAPVSLFSVFSTFLKFLHIQELDKPHSQKILLDHTRP